MIPSVAIHDPALTPQPLGGESIANVCLRVDRVIEHLCENCSGLRVVVVCHGGIIKSFRALIERVRQTDYKTVSELPACLPDVSRIS